MYISVKEVTSPVVKTMDKVEETPYDQGDLNDKGAAPSLNNELLPTQTFEEICSDNGNADEGSAACESENKEYRPVQPKETDEETMEAAHSSNESCAEALPDRSTSNRKTNQEICC
ncbi:hypothetical protein Bpfe_002696 [Biomphalaria pfeifferi]|uniref:Uncharacterized protein n=1 Tax=Biomphalaria pfeifferi TaxID=112525 RepID=A0AAD8C7N8_BIOPF|nr:hypothetical protein Bpfe_002696 [Biomphalaria pfeifferi]